LYYYPHTRTNQSHKEHSQRFFFLSRKLGQFCTRDPEKDRWRTHTFFLL
jgi:hypothetical protein